MENEKPKSITESELRREKLMQELEETTISLKRLSFKVKTLQSMIKLIDKEIERNKQLVKGS